MQLSWELVSQDWKRTILCKSQQTRCNIGLRLADLKMLLQLLQKVEGDQYFCNRIRSPKVARQAADMTVYTLHPYGWGQFDEHCWSNNVS